MSRRLRTSGGRDGALSLRARLRELRPADVAILGVLLVALLVGGASRENRIPAAIVALCATALYPLAFGRLTQHSAWPKMRVAILLLVSAALVPLIQVAPLPAEVWSQLPGRELVVEAWRQMSLSVSWGQISFAPGLTMRSAQVFVVAAAVFLSVASMRQGPRELGVLLILLITLFSLGLSLVQISGGVNSPAYFWPTTNEGSAVGFFANRNHEATLVVVALPLATSILIAFLSRNTAAVIAGYVGIAIAVALALAAVESRAGVVLLAPAALGSFVILWKHTPKRGRRGLAIGFVGAVVVAGGLIAAFGLQPLINRFVTHQEDVRFQVAPVVAQIAASYFPFGSGLGTFDLVFRAHEPTRFISPAFVNHAHNDYLELLLETGLLGAGLMVAYLVWFGHKVWLHWFRARPGDSLAQAATVVIGLILIHSSVDYPLRTMALAAVFAFANGLLLTVAPAPQAYSRQTTLRT